MLRRRRVSPFLQLALFALVLVALLRPGATGSAASAPTGGVVRIAMRGADVDSLDPALSYSVASWLILDPTCALLLRRSDDPRATLEPEVAAALPRFSPDLKTYTFTLRRGFRFSDGTPVTADAYARAINRTLAPGFESPYAAYTREIVGAEAVLAGRTRAAAGVEAHGQTLVVRFKRPAPDFPAQTTAFMCAVPPALPADPEGVSAFHAAGPYYISEYRAGERIVLRRNRFYGGTRPHRADGYTVDLRLSSQEQVLDRIERGEADWGWALSQVYFDPARRLAAKYGVNRSQFFVGPGYTFRGYAFNVSRPLFRNNPQLRQAVNFAIDRSALRRAAGGEHSSRLTDQYLPPSMAAFRDERIYPLRGPDLGRARELARGHTRSGKLVLFAIDLPNHVAFAQSIKRDLAEIGLDVRITRIPREAYFAKYMARGDYDLGFATWTPDYDDPYAVLNIQLDGRFIGATNWSRFNSPTFNRLLRDAARLPGAARTRAYSDLDVRLARDAAPMVAIDYLNYPVLVSKRIGCVGRSFELVALCIKQRS
jgi:peptide/nickel transport system substrate-binding protein